MANQLRHHRHDHVFAHRESEVFEYFRSAEYDPEEAGPILAEKQLKFPLLEKYPTDNGSKEPTLP